MTSKTSTARPSSLTRRQFYAKLRAAGFQRIAGAEHMRFTRTGVTYSKGTGPRRITVTVPKDHLRTAMVFGSTLPLTGVMFDTSEGGKAPLGRGFDHKAMGLPCFLWVVLALAGGHITVK